MSDRCRESGGRFGEDFFKTQAKASFPVEMTSDFVRDLEALLLGRFSPCFANGGGRGVCPYMRTFIRGFFISKTSPILTAGTWASVRARTTASPSGVEISRPPAVWGS